MHSPNDLELESYLDVSTTNMTHEETNNKDPTHALKSSHHRTLPDTILCLSTSRRSETGWVVA